MSEATDQYWREMLERDDEYTLSPDDQADLLHCYFKFQEELELLRYFHSESVSVLNLIAAPVRPDGTFNRDREACRELAQSTLTKIYEAGLEHERQA